MSTAMSGPSHPFKTTPMLENIPVHGWDVLAVQGYVTGMLSMCEPYALEIH